MDGGEHNRVAGEFRMGRCVFRQARTEQELEQVHRLNYETFVREIPQHDDDGTGRLIDRFHGRNIYFVAIRDGQVVGMVCVNDQPPFSIAGKLADPDALGRLAGRPLEVRLLAVRPGRRNTLVFAGLTWMVYRHARTHGHTHLLISALADRLELYQRFGFRPLGPAVASGGASFVPMVAAVDDMPADIHREAAVFARRVR